MSSKLSFPFKRIIVTRPPGQAEALVAALQSVVAEPVQVVHLPLLQIGPLDVRQSVPEVFSKGQNPPFAGVIFISSNAAENWFAVPDAAALTATLPLFAVGEGTASHLTRLTGREVTYPQQMNAEGLLALTPLNNIGGQHWLIVKGEGGRPLLRETLEQRGAMVSEIDVYQRKLPDYNIQQQHYKQQFESAVWLVTSAEALTNLYRILGLMEKPEHHTNLIVSSDRLAALARQKGFTIFDQSAGASQTQLVQCVKNCLTDSNSH